MGRAGLIQPKDFKYGVYGYYDPSLTKNDELTFVYVGIDKHIDEDRRYIEHAKPSKRLIISHQGHEIDKANDLLELSKTVRFNAENTFQKGQLVNNLIQDNKLEYQVLGVFVTKELMYDMETYYINKYQPAYNVKFKGWTEKFTDETDE